MIATYSGAMTAETSCSSFDATLALMTNDQIGPLMNTVDVVLVPLADGFTYNFTTTV